MLTNKQEKAIKIVKERYNKEKYTYISGFAGSGKSFIIPYIVDALGLYSDEVLYMCYTGKATQLLRNKGLNAFTIHKAIYTYTIDKITKAPRKHLKTKLDESYKLIVIDEVSMVTEELWKDILSFGIHVVAEGDPGQLPPVSGAQLEFIQRPHIFLDEVVRQAQDNEIIRVSMDIREGKSLHEFNGRDVRIIPRSDLSKDDFLNSDLVICGLNRTKTTLNNKYRSLLGYPDGIPVPGDRIISEQNNWDIISHNEDQPLTNGLICTVSNIIGKNPITIDNIKVPIYESKLILPNEDYYDSIYINKNILFNGTDGLDNKQKFKLSKHILAPHPFSFGYAVTCWKAQGDQYDKVILLADDCNFLSAEDRIKYLYTGVTRAVKECIILL